MIWFYIGFIAGWWFFHYRKESRTIYVLELTDNKKYVGSTVRPVAARYAEHAAGTGSKWTQTYVPIRIIKQFQGNKLDEHMETIRIMATEGVDTVRGGSWIMNRPMNNWEKRKLVVELVEFLNFNYQDANTCVYTQFPNQMSIPKRPPKVGFDL